MQKVRMYRDPLEPDRDIFVRDTWISDVAYQEVVQKMPIPCTDAMFVCDGGLYLGRRSVYPMKVIWGLGGRIFFNDRSLEESVSRCVKLETGYVIDPDRFSYVATHYYSWVKTAQGDFIGKNLAVTFRCDVKPEELATMARGLVQTEYEREFGLQRFDRRRLVDERVHPAMLDLYDDIFGK